jgi:hypothetical protein
MAVGEEFPNVTGTRGTQDGIGKRMGHRVGVGMTLQPQIGGNPLSAEDEEPARHQAVRVIPDSHPDRRAIRGWPTFLPGHAATISSMME